MANVDRRVKKTKKALHNALAEILSEKEIHCISIRELTDKADIHRATFYVHYKDIYDLYEQIENTVIAELSEIIKHDPLHSYDDIIKSLITYFYDNSTITHMLLTKNAKHSFYERVNQFLEDKYYEIWKYEKKIDIVNPIEYSFFIRYHLQGMLAILALWAESNFSYSQEQIYDILLKIDTNFDKIMY